MKNLILLATFLPLFAHGADWRYVTKSNDNSILYFIDISTINTAKIQRTVWINSIYRDIDEHGQKSSKYRYKVRCDDHEYSIMSGIIYSETGAVLWSKDYVLEEWESAIPDTIGDTWLSLVCSSKNQLLKAMKAPDPEYTAQKYWKTLDAEEQERIGAGSTDDTAEQMINRADNVR